MDPYRTSLEGQRARAEEAKKDALAEHDRLSRFLLQHLDHRLVVEMKKVRATLEGGPPDDATMDFWIEQEGHARTLTEAVGHAIAAATELRGALASPQDPPEDLHVRGIVYGHDRIAERDLERALPPDASELEMDPDRIVGTFRWSGHPMRVAACFDEALWFVVGTGVPLGGPKLDVGPAGIFHSNVTSDASFDAMYAVRGSDEAVATWLTPAVRKALLAIGRCDPARLAIDRGEAIIRYSFGIEDPNPLRQSIKALALLRECEITIPRLVRKR